MFEKSKSAITFKEFQNNMNIANNFYDDWGHFCDIDPSNNNPTPNANILFQDTLHKQKREFKKLFQKEQEENLEEDLKQLKQESEEQKEIEKIIKEIFVDIEEENNNPDENDNKKNNHLLKDARKVAITKNILKCFKVIFITSIMVHFIFNIL